MDSNTTGKYAVCAVARNENAYINDWINHHIRIGYNKVIIFDNNPDDTDPVENHITKTNLKKTDIVKVPDASIPQQQAELYNRALDEYHGGFDWITFIDVDEYVVTDSLSELFNSAPDDCDFLLLNWNIYDDNNIIVGDESVSVTKRFTHRYGHRCMFINQFYKTTVNCKRIREGRKLTASDPHLFTADSEPVYYNAKRQKAVFNDDRKWNIRNNLWGNNTIAHYNTKSLSEFMKYKWGRLSGFKNEKCYDVLDIYNYFFRTNAQTPEKTEFIKQYIRDNNIKLSHSPTHHTPKRVINNP